MPGKLATNPAKEKKRRQKNKRWPDNGVRFHMSGKKTAKVKVKVAKSFCSKAQWKFLLIRQKYLLYYYNIIILLC